MSNLIQNGDFQLPLLESGVDLQYDAMSPQQVTEFIWTGMSNTYLNNNIGYFDYPTPPTGISSQYVNFQFDSLLYQNINVSTKGKYALTLYHRRRPTNPSAGLDILLDDVLITMIPGDIPEAWSWVTKLAGIII